MPSTYKALGLTPQHSENKNKIILKQHKNLPSCSFQTRPRIKAKDGHILHIAEGFPVLTAGLSTRQVRSDLKGLIFHSFEIPATQLRALSNQSSDSCSVPGAEGKCFPPRCDMIFRAAPLQYPMSLLLFPKRWPPAPAGFQKKILRRYDSCPQN